MNYTLTSLWVQYSKDIYETVELTRSDTYTSPTIQEVFECHQNISLIHFLVITSIQLLSQDNTTSDFFQAEIEVKLTQIYREANALMNLTHENITVNVINITVRPQSDGDTADIFYYLTESRSNSSVCISSLMITYLMDLMIKLKGIQYVALKMGRIILMPISQVFRFELTNRVADSIGAGVISGIVISSLIGCFMITWCVLFVYFKCQYSRKVYCNRGVMCRPGDVYDQSNIFEDGGDTENVDQEKQISEKESNKYEISDAQKTDRTKNVEVKKKRKKRLKSNLKDQPQPQSEVIIAPSANNDDISTYSHVDTKPIISDESGSTPAPEKMSSNDLPITPPTFIPSISVNQIKSTIIWNPYRAADESRQIMLEEKHRNEMTTQVDAVTSPKKTHPIKERNLITGPMIKNERTIIGDSEYVGPITEADMMKKLNFIQILSNNNMLDENYTSIILDSRDL